MKIKVLHLRDSSGLFGAERVILNIISNRQLKYLEYELCCMAENEDDEIELISEAKKNGISTKKLIVRNRVDILSILKLRKILLDNHINIIHSHDYKSNFYALMATACTNVMRVTTAHGSTLNKALKTYSVIDSKFTLRKFHKIITVSPELTNNFLKNGYRSSDVVEVLNGLDLNMFKNNSISTTVGVIDKKASDAETIIGSVGRLFPEKGFEILIRSVAEIQSSFPSIALIIAGDGPDRSKLENMVKQLGLKDKVVFTGNMRNIERVYQQIDIFVLPSLREGLPNVILEAMYFEKPIVSTSVGAIPVVIEDKVSGCLVSPGDLKELTSAIRYCILNKEIVKSMAVNAKKELIEKYSATQMVKKIEKIYEEIYNNS